MSEYCNEHKVCRYLKLSSKDGFCTLADVPVALAVDVGEAKLFKRLHNCNGIIELSPSTTIPVPVNPFNREDVMSYHVGDSDYSQKRIQPWDIWEEYELNPWDADIIKRTLRNKESQSRIMDYEKIIHVCKKRISMLKKSK